MLDEGSPIAVLYHPIGLMVIVHRVIVLHLQALQERLPLI